MSEVGKERAFVRLRNKENCRIRNVSKDIHKKQQWWRIMGGEKRQNRKNSLLFLLYCGQGTFVVLFKLIPYILNRERR